MQPCSGFYIGLPSALHDQWRRMRQKTIGQANGLNSQLVTGQCVHTRWRATCTVVMIQVSYQTHDGRYPGPAERSLFGYRRSRRPWYAFLVAGYHNCPPRGTGQQGLPAWKRARSRFPYSRGFMSASTATPQTSCSSHHLSMVSSASFPLIPGSFPRASL